MLHVGPDEQILIARKPRRAVQRNVVTADDHVIHTPRVQQRAEFDKALADLHPAAFLVIEGRERTLSITDTPPSPDSTEILDQDEVGLALIDARIQNLLAVR